MSLYPDILFHFTDQVSLYEILNTTFKPSYAREKIIGPTEQREFAVPMVSFCDLKLSELKYFMSYGKFGIGLTKEWANRKKLNPVMYMNRHCELMDNLIKGVNGIYKYMDQLVDVDQINDLNKNYSSIINMYRYIKNYEGELIRKGVLVEDNYRFADEREWRYVPNLETDGVLPFVNIDKISTDDDKKAYNAKISHLNLHFKPDDIRYLIVEKDADIASLIWHLEAAKVRFDEETRRRVASRILTVDQILNDI